MPIRDVGAERPALLCHHSVAGNFRRGTHHYAMADYEVSPFAIDGLLAVLQS